MRIARFRRAALLEAVTRLLSGNVNHRSRKINRHKMFDKLSEELKKLKGGVKIPVKLPLDDDGYLDRECHAATCHAEFKVLFQDWREKVSDEKVYCPICRNEASSGDWNTDEQREYMKAVAIAHVQDVVHTALTEDAQRFNRAQRPGFIQISLSAKPGARPAIVPLEAAKAMRQQFTCEVCGCRYASIGVAFFCPACGNNSAVATFDQTIATVRKIVSLAPSIRSGLAKEYDEDLAQDSVRIILEDSLVRLVGAFQQYADALFEQLPSAISFKRHKNIFQNLSESSALWRSSVGKGYENMLSAAELQDLESLFQKRHLIAHRNGIVDHEYIEKSGDKTYSIGQRLVVREAAVLRLVDLLSKLAGELRRVA
jgi:uncharacterized Zn finger protein (UPF0148 family)